MTDVERIRFTQEATRRMAPYTLPYVATVSGLTGDLSPGGRLIGSAVRCEYGGRRAMMTALHVLEEANRYPQAVLSAGNAERVYRLPSAVDRDSRLDVALIWLPDDYPRHADIDFWPEDRIELERDRLSRDFLFAHGFPGEQSWPTALGSGIVTRSLPYGAMQWMDGPALAMEPYQFAMRYEPTGAWADEQRGELRLPDVHGMSGGPVWRIGVSGTRAAEWTPDKSLLVGLLTRWQQPDGMLVATHLADVRSALPAGALSEAVH